MEKIKTFVISITRILIAAIMRGTTVSQPRRLDMVGGMVPGTTGRNNTTITRGLGSTDVVSECSDPLVDQPSMDIMWCLKGSEGLNFYWIKWWPYDSLSSLYLKSILLSFHFHRQMIKIWVSSLSFSISLCPSYPGSIKRSKVFTSELLQRHHLQDDQAPVTEPHCNEGKTLCRRRECSFKKIAQLCFKCMHCTVPVLCKPTKRISRSALTQKVHSVILVGVVD